MLALFLILSLVLKISADCSCDRSKLTAYCNVNNEIPDCPFSIAKVVYPSSIVNPAAPVVIEKPDCSCDRSSFTAYCSDENVIPDCPFAIKAKVTLKKWFQSIASTSTLP